MIKSNNLIFFLYNFNSEAIHEDETEYYENYEYTSVPDSELGTCYFDNIKKLLKVKEIYPKIIFAKQKIMKRSNLLIFFIQVRKFSNWAINEIITSFIQLPKMDYFLFSF